MSGIRKSFPGVLAVDGVDFTVAPGEIHALLGENGAGKSTLLKILAGAQPPDEGRIELEGQSIELASPLDAQERGIVTIYQEFNLIPTLTVAENVFIGREPLRFGLVDWARMRRETMAITERVGLDLNPDRLVADLSVAEQQMVEIAKALAVSSKLIVMDEPTSALAESEVARLFAICRDLKAQGIGIVFVSHRLDEVKSLCDRLTVLRDGRLVGSADVADVTIDDIIRMMVGREVDRLFKRRGTHRTGEPALRVEGLSADGDPRDPSATRLFDISLTVARGEIVGLAGLVGAGRTELARAVFGADPIIRGRVSLDGVPVDLRSPEGAIEAGIGLVPEDRKQQALFLALAVRLNLSIAALGRLDRQAGLRRREGRIGSGRGLQEAAEHPDARAPGRGRQSLRRQPAEGGARPLAGLAAQGADRRRADPRHRRRGQGRGAPAPVRARRGRHRHSRHFLGAVGDPDLERPHPDHARRAPDRQSADRGGQRGAADAAHDRGRQGAGAGRCLSRRARGRRRRPTSTSSASSPASRP
jgi:inositol transport system ATP-binding protein